MPKLMDAEKIIDRISKETGKEKNEIKKLIEEKKRKFAGLLTDDGAAFMVAKELGVDIEFKTSFEEKVKLKDIVPGMRGIDIIARVKKVYMPRRFEKEKRSGIYQKLVIEDSTGEATVTLWGDEIKEASKKGLRKGLILHLKNCNVNEFNGNVTITLGYKGSFDILEKTEGLAEHKEEYLKIGKLKKDMQNVDLYCRVLRVFETREFEKDGERAILVRFEVSDGENKITVVAWREAADIASKLSSGEIIKIEDGFVKEGLKGLELHIDWRSNIVRNIEAPFEIPELEEILGLEIKRKNISEISADDSFVEIIGEVVDLLRGNLVYNFCTKCREKAPSEICENCQGKTVKRLVVSVTIDDGSGTINVSAYGKQAETILGKQTGEIIRMLESKSAEEILKELENKILGKVFLIRGVPRVNNTINELEILANDVKVPNFKEECIKLINSPEMSF